MKVAVVTPNEADAALAGDFLREHGILVQRMPRVPDPAMGDIAELGCMVLVEEALTTEGMEGLRALLESQPPWSDLPLLIITAYESMLLNMVPGLFPHSGNVTLLQRPIHPASLVSATISALRSRTRQYEVRDLLALRERAVRQRDEFLAMLAHELRNPLAPIRNAVYLLGTLRHEDPLFAKCRDMIDKQARHVTRLVDDLLDISRLELGKVELRPSRVDVNECVVAGLESCAALTSQRRHRITARQARQPLPVLADPVRLEQVVCNLLVNAAKFTPEGGHIDVETSAADGWITIAVTDDGIGIQPGMLERIFEPFAQEGVTLARSQGGLGIGLTLVKRLVELHGGSVRASSEGTGHGSRFEVRLPMQSGMAPETARPAARREGRPKHVLIVEDGVDNRDSLTLLVRAWKHEVTIAASGPDGVDRALASRPDVALVDIGLPGFDGYQVARRIRREGSEWSRNVRLIALTGYGQSDDREKALAAGFDMHLLKPVDPVDLRRALD